MANTAMLKGQRIVSPKGSGEVVETVGNDIVVHLDNGDTEAFSSEDITDNSSAG